MTIHQLSIFIENRAGTLVNVLKLLKQSNIQIIASTIADTAEYGIYRLICSEPMRAYKELQESGVAVALSDVFAIELDDQPGRAADAIEVFSNAGIALTYMYSFLFNGKGILIFRTDDAELARKTIEDNHLSYITEGSLQKLS
ncbi:MAG: amino acid-binding protein [Prevotella sp.]|nr:amino acid-binding protein [Prevotella sp.]